MKSILKFASLAFLLVASTSSFAAKAPKAAPPVTIETPKAPKPRSGGIYTDSAGHRHPWEINEAHALIWDGSPYIPVGGMFCSKYLTFEQTDANWNDDIQGLDTLKSKGIRDLYINPVRGATGIPSEAWQKMIDALEERGFRYGIELADGPAGPVSGYLVKARSMEVQPHSTLALSFPKADRVAYAVLDADGDILDSAAVAPSDGDLILTIPAEGVRVMLTSREKIPVQDTGLQNFWEGFPDYRDRVLELFAKIKLGPNFRFFTDPLANEMGMRGEAGNLIPDSAGFRMELEVYLQQRYREIEGVTEKWTPEGEGPTSFEVAARLIPLQQGAGVAYDPESGRFYRCTDQLWKDLVEFRDRSIRGYMNSIADLLKTKVANVPVVYKWTHPHRIFTNSDTTGGFDGLGMEAYSRDQALALTGGLPVLSQAEDAARTQWVIVTETENTASSDKPDMGYPNEQQMKSDLDWLRLSGAKGFFIFGFQLLPQPTWNNFELIRDTKQLDWLVNYRTKLEAIPDFATDPAEVLYYPAMAGTTAKSRMLETGTWWAPTLRKGVSLGLPKGMDGYYFPDGDTPTCVIWSTAGMQKITFVLRKDQAVQILASNGKPLNIQPDKRQRLTLMLTEEPLQIRGMKPIEIFPPEIAKAALADFTKMVAEAEARKIPAYTYKQVLSNAKIVFTDSMARVSYDLIRRPMEMLRRQLADYVWIEGEESTDQSFTEIAPDGECSNGAYLKLWSPAEPSGDGYRVRYSAEVKEDGNYNLWIAGTPPGSDWASAMSYSVDSGEAVPAQGEILKGSQYNHDFYWSKLGALALTKGKHTLEFRVTGRRKSPDTDYVMYLDALVLSSKPFTPNGIVKP